MEVQKSTEVQQLNISDIKPDPKQPRKTFNEQSLQLLSDSITEHGVLQPITVRPNGKKHIIVMGERRYRASKLAKLKTIPCIIRDFDSNVISEVQIIENLQRQDVEPIEEAEAIALLLEKYTADEIATRIGRTVKFIYGRIKLANLIDGFRPFVKSKEMTISLAIGVASFPEDDQQMFLESMGETFRKYSIENAIQNKMFDLDTAPFDLNNAKLVPTAGACTVCPFNSANQGSLFGDNKQICTKSSCYSAKKTKALLALIEKVKKDGRLLVPDFGSYNIERSENQLVLSLLKENGLKPYMRDDITYLEKPVKPTKAIIKEENSWMDYTEDELSEELEGALEEYNEELEEYQNATSNGYSPGVLLNSSSYEHKEVLMALRENLSDTPEDVPLSKKKMDDCTPKEKIQKINIKEERKKHLDDNKLFVEIMDTVSDSDYINSKKALSVDEMVAISISMYENLIGYYHTKEFKGFYGKNNAKTKPKTVERFKKNFKKETFNRLIRLLIVKNVHFNERNHNNDVVNNSAFIVFKNYCKKEIEAIEAKYAEATTLREQKLNARIADLEKQLSEKKE